MRSRLRLLIAGLVFVLQISNTHGQKITWADLLPQKPVAFDDPFEKLTEDQLADLAMVARIRYLIENNKCDADGPNAAQEKLLVAKLKSDGLDVDALISQRERVAKMRRHQNESVNEGINGQDIRIAGYVLPLQVVEGRVTEFLLVPEMGGCLHNTPVPASNQMIHVSYPSGIEDRGRTNAVIVIGKIQLEPANYNLILVDGMASVNVAYTAQVEDITSLTWARMLRLRQPTESPGRDTRLGENRFDLIKRYDQQN